MTTSHSKVIRFSIADSDFYFKEILTSSILKDPKFFLVTNANNGHELVRQIHLRQEDVFLIDLYMPIMSGIEAIKFIRASGNTAPIITYGPTFQQDVADMLTEQPKVFYCQKKGIIIADLLKNYVLSPYKRYQDYISEWSKEENLIEGYKIKQQRGWYTPSLIEVQLMKLCYEGLSNKEMGIYLNLSARTVDTYIKRLTDKLGLKSKIDLIRFCVENGYYNISL